MIQINQTLTTNSALIAVENKVPDVSCLVTKTDYNTKISEIERKNSDHDHDKYITTPEFTNLVAGVFTARLVKTNLVTKTDFDNKLQSLSKRITSNKTRHLLVENELKDLQKFDSSVFRGKIRFEKDGEQNYFVCQPMYRYFKKIAGVGSGKERKSGSCSEQVKATYNQGKIVNISMVYESNKNYNICSYATLENCLFGAISFTKHINIDQYKYSGYGIGFDRKGEFSFCYGFGRNLISSSVNTNNRTKKVFVLRKDLMQGLKNTTIYAEKLYSVNFSKRNTILCLSLHYNGANSYLFVNGTEIHKFKAKYSEIMITLLCLGNISKEISADNMKKIRLNGYVYDFSVDYDAIAVDDILDIYKYLIEKNNIISKCLDLLKYIFFTAMTFFSFNVLNVNSLECVLMNNQKCKIRSEIINVNTNEPIFYPNSITINKCKDSCNTIDDPYAKLCVPDTIENINVKVFNLMSRTNETSI